MENQALEILTTAYDYHFFILIVHPPVQKIFTKQAYLKIKIFSQLYTPKQLRTFVQNAPCEECKVDLPNLKFWKPNQVHLFVYPFILIVHLKFRKCLQNILCEGCEVSKIKICKSNYSCFAITATIFQTNLFVLFYSLNNTF